MSPFEAAMIVCFGVSWPVAIWKTLKTKHVHGKSLTFLVLVASGYGFGMIHKAIHNFDWVILLYGFNLLMVLSELGLCLFYGKQNNIFDSSATADTLFDNDDIRRAPLRLISATDGPAIDIHHVENPEDHQVKLVQNIRKHGW